jgi:hypothetical protein
MSDYKVGDKAWMRGTVRQVSEADEHNPVTTYMVEIDNHEGHTDTVPIRFREGELLRSLDTETEATVVTAYVESVRQRERAAIVTWLRDGGPKLIAAAIERGAHLRGDDE